MTPDRPGAAALTAHSALAAIGLFTLGVLAVRLLARLVG